jgi:hypothetical protein
LRGQHADRHGDFFDALERCRTSMPAAFAGYFFRRARNSLRIDCSSEAILPRLDLADAVVRAVDGRYSGACAGCSVED